MLNNVLPMLLLSGFWVSLSFLVLFLLFCTVIRSILPHNDCCKVYWKGNSVCARLAARLFPQFYIVQYANIFFFFLGFSFFLPDGVPLWNLSVSSLPSYSQFLVGAWRALADVIAGVCEMWVQSSVHRVCAWNRREGGSCALPSTEYTGVLKSGNVWILVELQSFRVWWSLLLKIATGHRAYEHHLCCSSLHVCATSSVLLQHFRDGRVKIKMEYYRESEAMWVDLKYGNHVFTLFCVFI